MTDRKVADAAAEREADRQLALLRRGAVDCVQEPELRKRLVASVREGRPLRVKLGFDPTSTDLHLGHSVVLRKLRQFQELGHHAIFIVGGATAMLGDPSGKDRTRPQLTREQVEENARSYLEQAFKVVRRDELWSRDGRRGEIEVTNNADWLLKLDFAAFLRLCAQMTVARMVERDSFAKRLKEGSPIGIHEFLYPLLQARDSVEVRCDVELGGTDQLFNLLVGRDLQVDAGQPPQICMTTPLLPGLDGKQKMSKSLGNHVGLVFPPDEVFGKVMSIPDAVMPQWFELLTEPAATEAAAEATKALVRDDPRAAKADLAERITTWLHDADAGAKARQRFDQVFREGDVDAHAEPRQIDAADAPGGRIWMVKLLVLLGFARTNGEARRLIEGGGVKLNHVPVKDEKLEVVPGDGVLVKAGKRRFAFVTVKARD
jgi:tyrosyl-tRNA synthetase